MGADWKAFCRSKDFLVCVDSDGCAMDTMNIKHIRCFGPCMVREWKLEAWSEPILARWNQINLYSLTRGINRYKGLAKALAEIDTTYQPIPGITELCAWVENAKTLSNAALEQAAAQPGASPILAKALRWSRAVNESVTQLPMEEKKPFDGVVQALAAAHQAADVAVVSSANQGAVLEEWGRCGLLKSTDLVCSQEAGPKAFCLQALLDKGYAPGRLLMCGDAPGDLEAAESCGVLFYPILVRREAGSWAEFTERALPALLDGSYAGSYQRQKREEFLANLHG
jgi:phosphoglycolate phosphatase-like HAD superfamily hydrolase